MCCILLLHLFCLYLSVYGENLIKNPGFEEEENSLPADWFLFVQPQEGSYGKIDKKISHSGKNSISLNNTHLYPKEPLNNWSQRIFVNESKDKKIYLEGWIKTNNVSKAYFLLQFWQQNPTSIIESKKTEILSRTNDWKKLNLITKIPLNTHFIVVRCVIEGIGSAWFDDLSLTLIENDSEEVLNSEEKKFDKENIEDKINKIDQRIEELLNENLKLKEKMKSLEEENKKIKEELEKVYIKKEKESKTENNIIEKPEGTSDKVPILVPHKKD